MREHRSRASASDYFYGEDRRSTQNRERSPSRPDYKAHSKPHRGWSPNTSQRALSVSTRERVSEYEPSLRGYSRQTAALDERYDWDHRRMHDIWRPENSKVLLDKTTYSSRRAFALTPSGSESDSHRHRSPAKSSPASYTDHGRVVNENLLEVAATKHPRPMSTSFDDRDKRPTLTQQQSNNNFMDTGIGASTPPMPPAPRYPDLSASRVGTPMSSITARQPVHEDNLAAPESNGQESKDGRALLTKLLEDLSAGVTAKGKQSNAYAILERKNDEFKKTQSKHLQFPAIKDVQTASKLKAEQDYNNAEQQTAQCKSRLNLSTHEFQNWLLSTRAEPLSSSKELAWQSKLNLIMERLEKRDQNRREELHSAVNKDNKIQEQLSQQDDKIKTLTEQNVALTNRLLEHEQETEKVLEQRIGKAVEQKIQALQTFICSSEQRQSQAQEEAVKALTQNYKALGVSNTALKDQVSTLQGGFQRLSSEIFDVKDRSGKPHKTLSDWTGDNAEKISGVTRAFQQFQNTVRSSLEWHHDEAAEMQIIRERQNSVEVNMEKFPEEIKTTNERLNRILNTEIPKLRADIKSLWDSTKTDKVLHLKETSISTIPDSTASMRASQHQSVLPSTVEGVSRPREGMSRLEQAAQDAKENQRRITDLLATVPQMQAKINEFSGRASSLDNQELTNLEEKLNKGIQSNTTLIQTEAANLHAKIQSLSDDSNSNDSKRIQALEANLANTNSFTEETKQTMVADRNRQFQNMTVAIDAKLNQRQAEMDSKLDSFNIGISHLTKRIDNISTGQVVKQMIGQIGELYPNLKTVEQNQKLVLENLQACADTQTSQKAAIAAVEEQLAALDVTQQECCQSLLKLKNAPSTTGLESADQNSSLNNISVTMGKPCLGFDAGQELGSRLEGMEQIVGTLGPRIQKEAEARINALSSYTKRLDQTEQNSVTLSSDLKSLNTRVDSLEVELPRVTRDPKKDFSERMIQNIAIDAVSKSAKSRLVSASAIDGHNPNTNGKIHGDAHHSSGEDANRISGGQRSRASPLARFNTVAVLSSPHQSTNQTPSGTGTRLSGSVLSETENLPSSFTSRQSSILSSDSSRRLIQRSSLGNVKPGRNDKRSRKSNDLSPSNTRNHPAKKTKTLDKYGYPLVEDNSKSESDLAYQTVKDIDSESD